jgi:metal-sulfur cluster biosynthetic enzyme
MEVMRILNAIVDPCSIAAGMPIGLVDMGIVQSVEVQGDAVRITLLPTFPGCIYTAVFSDEIARRLAEVGWTGEVAIELDTSGSIWDEDRMEPAARKRLSEVRAARRQRAEALRTA